MRKNKKINIIYKDDQIVVCEKPKGIPVSSDKTGDIDLLHLSLIHISEPTRPY